MAFEDKAAETAKRLKSLRVSNSLSLEKLAAELSDRYEIHISKDSLINFEKSDKKFTNGMKTEYLRCFADYYKVSTDYLLGVTDEPIPDPTIQSVCSYTGLSGAAVKTLHSYESGSIQHSFTRRFLDDLLSDCAIATIITDCLIKYVYAKKLSITQTLCLSNRDEVSDNLPTLEDGKYRISASDAADLYYGQAIAEAQGSVESIIRQMSEEMLRPYHIGKPNSVEIERFRWKVYSEDE